MLPSEVKAYMKMFLSGNTYVYTYIYTHTYTYTYTYAYTYAYTYTYKYTYIHIHIHVHRYICTRTRRNINMFGNMLSLERVLAT